MSHTIAALLMVFNFGFLAQAEVISYNPLPVEVKAGDQIHVRAFVGNIKVTGNDKATQLTVRVRQENPDKLPSFAKALLDDWALSIQRDGNSIEVVVRSPQSKSDWRQLLIEGGFPRFDIEISGPSLPIVAATRQGSVTLSKWMAGANLQTAEGSIKVEGGKGDVGLSVQNGEVAVSDRQGKVKVESFNGAVKLRSIKGRVELENFSGDSELVQIEGSMEINASRGATKLANSRGSVEFFNGRGQFKVDNLEGALKGQVDQGAVIADLRGEVDVRINSKDGPIQISAPNSGASVNVGTKDGSFGVPSYLAAYDTANMKLVQGRLRGGLKGQIYIRTETGTVRIR